MTSSLSWRPDDDVQLLLLRAEAVDVKLARETLLHVPYLCALVFPFLLSDYIRNRDPG